MEFDFWDMVLDGWMLFEHIDGSYQTIQSKSEATN